MFKFHSLPSLIQKTSWKQMFHTVKPGIISPRRHIPDHILRPPYAETGEVPPKDNFIPILDQSQIDLMRQSCQLAAKMLKYAGSCIKVGRTTDEIDQMVHEEILRHNAYPSPMNYCGFPKSICTSVNEVILHGIPDNRPLEDGDTISIDVSVYLNGFHGDNCGSFIVGSKNNSKTQHLLDTTKYALNEAIELCKPNVPFNHIGKRIHRICKEEGYDTVRAFAGHGVGETFHALPYILHYENEYPGVMLPGMVFTIEPMLCEGSEEHVQWDDGWTIATKDGKRAAQYEHAILITETGHEILTHYEDKKETSIHSKDL